MSIVYNVKGLLRAVLPEQIFLAYHRMLAAFGAMVYRHPSRKMVVIGVTGTKGKTSVVYLLSDILRHAGEKVGFISGTSFRIADESWPNLLKMTMPGRFKLQKLLRQMVDAGCTYAIVETTSEGIRQHRQRGIEYDVAVLTNLSPEHIESHGSFEKYREAKGRLFASLGGSYRKVLDGKKIPKVKILNRDDEHFNYFTNYFSDSTYFFSTDPSKDGEDIFVAKDISLHGDKSEFMVRETKFSIPLIGQHNAYNSLTAITTCSALGVSLNTIKEALQKTHPPPGRLEEIKNSKGFHVFVDYAHEPASLRAAFESVRLLQPHRLISVLGSQGGGRDKSKRSVMGGLAAEFADMVIVTNEDPYDEPPQDIIDDVIKGVVMFGRKKFTEGNNLLKIIDRREAINKAISLAQKKDVVLISGKGGEQIMVVKGGKHIPWNDAEIAKKCLR
ncbi:Mur ligase family protein [Patescibacteria group bacterium]